MLDPSPAEELSPARFVHVAATAANELLSRSGSAPQLRVRARLAQFWYGDDDSVHYELWARERQNQLELGLHFESTAARNRELYQRFDCRLLEIQSLLGPTIWLEEWDRGWARLYETLPLFPLDGSRAYIIAQRLFELIAVIQPIYEFVLAEDPALAQS